MVLIAAALGTWALKRYLPPERLRQIVLAEAKKILHREVSTGRISIGVVHGLVVEDIAISEYPDFKAGRFAEAGSFALRLRLMPLLRRQVELDKVAVDGLKLSVVRRADGSFNFSDLSGSTAAARTPAAPPEKSLSLSISKASLRNAQLSYRDLKTGDAWKVGVPSAKVSDFRMDGPFSSDFQLTAQGRLAGKPVNVAVSFSGKADIGGGDVRRMSAAIKQLRLEESGRELRVSGKIHNLAAPELDVAVDLRQAGSDILSVEAKGVVTSTGAPPAAAGELALKLRTPGFDPASLRLSEFVPVSLPKGVIVPQASVEGRFKLAGNVLGLADVKAAARLGKLEMSGKLSRVFSGKPEPDLKILVRLDIPQTAGSDVPMVKLPAGLVIPQAEVDAQLRLKPWDADFDFLKIKTAMAQVEASGTLADLLGPEPRPKDLKAKVRLDLPRFKSSSAPWLKLPEGLVVPAATADAEFSLQGWDAAISVLRVQTGDSRVELSGTVRDLMGKPAPRDLKAKAHLDIPQLKGEDIPGAKLPAGLIIPASIVDADFSLRSWDMTLTSLRLKTAAAQVEASGTLRDLLSGKPQPVDFKAKARIESPQMKASDVPFAKLPAGLVIPAAVLDASLRCGGADVVLESLNLKTKAGEASAKGVIKGALAGKPEPDIEAQAKFDLPAFKSADLPFAQVPAGLEIPAIRLDVDAAGGLDAVNFKRLRVILGKNDLEVSGPVKGLRGAAPNVDLMLKCRSFVLNELTAMTPETRDLKLSGGGFFALGVSGPVSKPVLSGKLKFQGLGATVSGLTLADFTGTASFDERRIDVPNLSGKVADGALNMDLTLKNYRTEPFVDVEASLDRFDLGKYLAAKAALAAKKEAAPAKAAAPGKPAPPLATKGKFTVGALMHPNMAAKDVRLSWELEGITPELKALDGWAKLLVAGGNFSNIGKMATQSVIVKVLTLPFMVIQKIGGIGGIRIFPDFNNIAFTEISGDYAFAKGLMTLRDSHLYSDAAQVSAAGAIDLPTEKLDLLVTAQVANVAPMDIKVTGSFDKPKTKVQLGKFIADPAKALIKNIFQRPPQEEASQPQGQ